MDVREHLRLLAPMPLPYLLLQLGVGAAWLGLVAMAVRRWGSRGLWMLATAPIALFGWYLASLAGLFLVCAFEGSCI